MLDLTLQFLTDALNSYILTSTGSSTEVVRMSRLVDESGKYAFEKDSICATLINIEEERVLKSQLPQYTLVNGQHVKLEPELKLNLTLMLAANFKLYDVALKYLSLVLTFFQAHPFFTPDAYPALDPRTGRLTLELQSLTFEQLNQIWAFVGGKYLPSVVYKVRMDVLQEITQSAVQPPVTVISANVGRR